MKICKFPYLAVLIGPLLALVPIASAQQPALPPTMGDPQLKACQEQLAASRGAVTKIHLPNAAFQAEALVTLDTRLADALQQHAQDVATIEALQKELAALRQSGAPAKPEG